MKAFASHRVVMLLSLLSAGCESEEERQPAARQAEATRADETEREPRDEAQKPEKKAERKASSEAAETAEHAPTLQRRPTEPDPHGGEFTLDQALEGLEGKGALVASIETSKGELRCELFEERAPLTVANFVGLARGTRAFWDARHAEWVKRRYYDGTTFHRVIPGFVIQGGDYLGNGTGTTGYEFDDEIHPALKHDRAGLLCMANRGPDTNSAQFFITDGAAPHLDGSFTIFGRCEPLALVSRIARAGTDPPVAIEKVRIARSEQGVPQPPAK